jgi:2-methylcitrate dehydratase PrpD
VDFGVHPEAEAAGYDKMTTIIEINLTDGRRIGGRADFGKGSPSNPMSYDEVADKFRECAAYSRWPQQKAEQVIEAVRGMEGLRNVRELTALLSRSTAGAGRKKSVPAPRSRSNRQKSARGAQASKAARPRKRSR